MLEHAPKSVLLATLRERALSGDGLALDAMLIVVSGLAKIEAIEEAHRVIRETLNARPVLS